MSRTDEAAQEIRVLSPRARRLYNDAVRELRRDPSGGEAKKLDGFNTLWRVRIGCRRIVYQLNSRARVITVLRVRRREIVYDDLVEPRLPC